MWAAGGGSGIGGRLVSSASRLMSHTSVFSVAVRVAISRKTFNGSSVSTRSVFMEPSAYPWRKPPRDHPYEGGNGRPRSKSWRYSAYLKAKRKRIRAKKEHKKRSIKTFPHPTLTGFLAKKSPNRTLVRRKAIPLRY
ncbi:hypothetical protein MDAP_002601 [Mitosporidium daphniae]